MKIREHFFGCILGGAIGDAFGSSYEQTEVQSIRAKTYYPFGRPVIKRTWAITDDTQLTLATCEAIATARAVDAESIARRFLFYFRQHKLTGLGSSTLKALQELGAGGHWRTVGRQGERAAGNGAAMRIAPLAFVAPLPPRQLIEEISRITHHHPEAYAGSLAVVLALQSILTGEWTGTENLFDLLIPHLPDTRVRDRLLELREAQHSYSIPELGRRFGSSGYVVDSVPLALAAANQVKQLGFENMLKELILAGGDTDTNCSIACQVAGALLGVAGIPPTLRQQLQLLPEYPWLENTMLQFAHAMQWQ